MLGLCWGLAAVAALVWAAAKIASGLAAGRCESFGVIFVTDLARGDTRAAWPGTPTTAVIAAAVALSAAAGSVVLVVWRLVARLRADPDDPVAALRANPGIAPLAGGPARRTLPQPPNVNQPDLATFPNSRCRVIQECVHRAVAISDDRHGNSPRWRKIRALSRVDALQNGSSV